MTPEHTQTKVERPCPVCGATNYAGFTSERIDAAQVSAFTYSSRKQPEFMCLRLVRCLGCDLVYAPTPPAAEFLNAAYAEAAYDSAEEASAAADSYAKALRRYVDQLPNRNGAVDVGAGSGPLLPWLRDQGFAPVIGIEPSLAAIAAAPPEVAPLLRQGMFTPDLLGDTQSSLICSFMTLEHLAEPGVFVQNAFESLEPGGMIAIVVHNWRAPLNRLLGLRSPIIDVEHLQLFSPLAVDALLSRAGFCDIAQRSISNTYPLRYWLRLTPLPSGPKGQLAALLERIGLASAPISLRVGNLLAVGYKPIVHQI